MIVGNELRTVRYGGTNTRGPRLEGRDGGKPVKKVVPARRAAA